MRTITLTMRELALFDMDTIRARIATRATAATEVAKAVIALQEVDGVITTSLARVDRMDVMTITAHIGTKEEIDALQATAGKKQEDPCPTTQSSRPMG